MSVGIIQILIVVALVILFFAPKKIGSWGGSLGKTVGRKRRKGTRAEGAEEDDDDTMSQAMKAAKMARKLHKASRGGFPWN